MLSYPNANEPSISRDRIRPMAPLKPALDDLAAREPVWSALSELFLDTDVSLSRTWRAQQLAQSPYALEQLEFILVEEVYPVCKYNLLSVAGEWAGFDVEWLRARILHHLQARSRVWRWFNLGRFSFQASSEWQATKRAVLEARAKAANNAA